jgi:hypothetical protein
MAPPNATKHVTTGTSSGSQTDFDKSKVREEAPAMVGDKIPLLHSDWSKKGDGSVTAFVSNSRMFRDGTEIAPIRTRLLGVHCDNTQIGKAIPPWK